MFLFIQGPVLVRYYCIFIFFYEMNYHAMMATRTWKNLEKLDYAIGTWKTWKIGRKSQKPGISEIIPGKTNEFAWGKAVHEVFFFSYWKLFSNL